MESVWPVSKLSTEPVGSRRELVANCVHTADATKQFRRRRRCVLGISLYKRRRKADSDSVSRVEWCWRYDHAALQLQARHGVSGENDNFRLFLHRRQRLSFSAITDVGSCSVDLRLNSALCTCFVHSPHTSGVVRIRTSAAMSVESAQCGRGSHY